MSSNDLWLPTFFVNRKIIAETNECRKDSHIFLPSRLMGRLKQSTWRTSLIEPWETKTTRQVFQKKELLKQQKTAVEFPGIMGSMYEKGPPSPTNLWTNSKVWQLWRFGFGVWFRVFFSFRFVYDYSFKGYTHLIRNWKGAKKEKIDLHQKGRKLGKVFWKKVCQWLKLFDSSIEKIPEDRSE